MAETKQRRIIAAIFHFIRFLLPVLAGSLAFYFGCVSRMQLPLGWIVTILIAFPMVFFMLFPALLRVTKLSTLLAKLPDWLLIGLEGLLLLAYTYLLGMGFQFNHREIPADSVRFTLWTAFLVLSLLFVLLFITRKVWTDWLPHLQRWEGRIRLISLGLVLLLVIVELLPGVTVPAFLIISVLVVMGLCLALTLLRLSWPKLSGEAYFKEVSGFIFLAFGFVLMILSIQ